MTSPEDAKKMIDDMVKKATDLAENQLTGLPKLVEKFMLSDRQIAKKIISIKSPKLSDVDLNLIVYGKDLKKELGSSYRAFVSENEKLNPRVISKDLKSSFKALEDDNPIFEEVKNQPRIVVVNTAVPRAWRDENNALIAQYASVYGAYLVDWAAVSDGHPEYFAPDGVHLVPAGVRAYVDAIILKL